MVRNIIQLSLHLFICFVSLTTWALDSISLEAWLSKYSSNNPISALKKVTPFFITKATMDDLMDGDQRVSTSHFDYLTKFNVSQPDINNIIDDLLTDISTNNLIVDKRDLKIRNNLERFFGLNEAKDVLRIAYVGVFHSLDYYLTHSSQQLTYITKPVRLESEQYTEGFREFIEISLHRKVSVTAAEDIHSFAWAHYNYVLSTLMTENIMMPKVVAGDSKNKFSWLIGELHNINETQWLDELPKANELLKAGIRKIKFAIEGVPWGATNIETLLRRRTLHEEIDFTAKRLELTTEQLVDRLFSPDLKQKFWAGELQDNPAIVVLLNRLKKYENNGIVVELVGIEDKNYNSHDD